MRYLALLMIFFMTSTAISKGGVTSSGGDSVAAEFTMTGRHIANILEDEVKTGVSGRDFLNAVNSTLVVSNDKVFLDGYEREAINYPALKRIVVSRDRWRETANQIGRRYMLVMHEYLSIMGIDDSKYQISSRLFAANGKKRIEIVCSPFNDIAVVFGALYKLHYILYEDREITIVKTSDGKIPSPPLGQSLASGISLSDKKGALLFVVNFGMLRNIQVPYSFDPPTIGPLEGSIMWDTQPNGQTAEVHTVHCEAHKW